MDNCIKIDELVWDPAKIFVCPADHKYAVIILNQPILLNENFLLPLWQKAQIRVTVDGGTNRWLKYLGPLSDKVVNGTCTEYIPDMITGDFDSILPETLAELQSIGVNIIKTPDQLYTDYSKSLMQLSDSCKAQNIKLNAVYVIVENTGRFDQIISNVHTLYQTIDQNWINEAEMIINVASNSLTWLLRPGKHRIIIPKILRDHQAWVGIIPFGSSKNCLSSTGLKYNLDKTTLSFGGLLSTSNTYDGSPEVTITTDTSIIWSMGIEPYFEVQNNST